MTCQAKDFADEYCDEPCESWEEKTVVARVQHRCSECNVLIPKGERYERATGLLSGEGWKTWRRCMVCVALQEMIVTKLDICVPFGALAAYCADSGEYSWLNFSEWQTRHGNWPLLPVRS